LADPADLGGLQHEALVRCQDPKPLSAEEARRLIALFAGRPFHVTPDQASFVVARAAFDQSVRLQESNERLSKWLIVWTIVLVILTVALVFLTVALVFPESVQFLTHIFSRHRTSAPVVFPW
jgi:hypothetical protein